MLRILAVLAFVVSVSGCSKSEPTPAATAKPAASSNTAPSATPAQAGLPSPVPAAAPTPAWKPIPGGKECRFAGVIAEVPATWNILPQGNATIVMPQGANQAAVEELYGFIGEPTLKTLDAPGLEAYLDSAVMQLLQVPAQRAGPGQSAKVGALDAKVWTWNARLMDGRDAQVKAWAFVGSYTGAFVAVATPDAMNRRQPEIDSILGSVHRPATAAIDAARLCGTWVRAFGGGTALIGNANEQRITFDSSGRFQYHSEGTSHGVFHNSSSQTDISGSWRLVGDQLTGISDTGETQTFTLEARTEAGTGAAVIAIDGTEFRQAEGMPW